jgi:hypothetical protein
VDFNFTVVRNESQFAESVHEEVNARASSPNHLRQHLLAYSGNHLLRRFFLAKLRQQQKDPGEALFAGIEELIHQVFLNAGIAGQKMGNENIREGVLLVQRAYHRFSIDFE